MHVYYVDVEYDFFLISWLDRLHSDNTVTERNAWESRWYLDLGRFKVSYNIDTSTAT